MTQRAPALAPAPCSARSAVPGAATSSRPQATRSAIGRGARFETDALIVGPGGEALVGGLGYLVVVIVLRASGKRTLAKLNAFDLVVTVAFGSVLATIALSKDVALAEGAAAVLLLAAAQFAVALLTTNWPLVRHLVTADPVVVLRDGELVESALEGERLTVGEIRQAVRSAGIGGLEQVAAVVLETDGTLSVIPRSAAGSGSALEGL